MYLTPQNPPKNPAAFPAGMQIRDFVPSFPQHLEGFNMSLPRPQLEQASMHMPTRKEARSNVGSPSKHAFSFA